MSQTVGVAVIGSGFMGRTWAHVAGLDPRCRLTAVTGGTRATALATDYGVPVSGSVEELVRRGDTNVVIIASPPNVHLEQAVLAAAEGKHILVEKPMARNPAESQAMVDAAAARGVKLSVVSHHRFRDSPRSAKRLIDSGEIGRIRMVRVTGVAQWWDMSKTHDEWKKDPAQLNPFADWGSHACDLLRWFVGAAPVTAYAQADSFSETAPSEQSIMATYRFEDGVIASVWMTYEVPPPGLGSPLQILVTGSDGLIDMDTYGAVLLGKDGEWREIFRQQSFDATDPTNPVRLEAYQRQLADLLDAIDHDTHPLVSGSEGVQTQNLLFASLESSRTGLPVAVHGSAEPRPSDHAGSSDASRLTGGRAGDE